VPHHRSLIAARGHIRRATLVRQDQSNAPLPTSTRRFHNTLALVGWEVRRRSSPPRWGWSAYNRAPGHHFAASPSRGMKGLVVSGMIVPRATPDDTTQEGLGGIAGGGAPRGLSRAACSPSTTATR
jgi:hypothetical protein